MVSCETVYDDHQLGIDYDRDSDQLIKCDG